MSIERIHETTHGTFEQVMEHIRKLHDTHGLQHINVTFSKPKKPLVVLCVQRDDEVEGATI